MPEPTEDERPRRRANKVARELKYLGGQAPPEDGGVREPRRPYPVTSGGSASTSAGRER